MGTCTILNSLCENFNGNHPTSECGDGLPGSPPPLPYGDVDDPHTVLEGTYAPATNKLAISGCFDGIENALLGPAVWANVTINGQTGEGTANIWTALDAGCPGDKPGGAPTFQDAPVQSAEQPADWDTDQDNCSNATELGNNGVTIGNPQGAGGLRDPYNRWDWMDQFINGQTDGAVVVGDIGALVSRFGTVDPDIGVRGPLDPKVPPTGQFNYHVQADRAGALVGSAGAWNAKPPDGSIVVGDIGAVVAQFGHAGCGAKTP